MKKSTVVFMVIIIIFLAAVLFLLYLNFNKTPSTVTIASTPTISPDPQVCTDPTAGFSIKYPENYIFEPTSCSYSPSYYSVDVDDGLSKNYIITINTEKSSDDISTWIDKRKICSGESSCTKQIPGPITNSVQFNSVGARYALIDTLLKNNDTIIDIKLRARKPKVPISEIAKQKYNDIVSTIVFSAN